MARSTDKLSDTAVRQAKPRERQYKLHDGGQMYLLVKPDGSKLWMMDYHHHGKRNTASFGLYPTTTLKQARKARQEAKEMLSKGVSPNQQKKRQRMAGQLSSTNLFETIAGEWHQKKLTNWDPHHAEVIWRRLELHVFPHIGKCPVDTLKALDLLYPLLQLEKSGKLTLAGQVRQYMSGIMRYAVQTGRIDSNPALDLKDAIAAPKQKHYPALPLDRLHELKLKIDTYPYNPVVKLAMQFALLTGARSSEFRFARWSEFDLKRGEWVIPPEREEIAGTKHSNRGEKMKTARIIPLATQTVKIIKELQAINGRNPWVFASTSKSQTPISENTPNATLRRLGYDTQKDICLHGFRTMACSALNESGLWQRDAIERHMGHQERNKVRSAYIHKAEYLTERRTMLQWWADYLDAIIKNTSLQAADFKPTIK